MRTLVFSAALLLFAQGGAHSLSAATYTAAPADGSLLTEKFSVLDNTAVPGATLKSGSYVIRVVDHMSDRSILRIETDNGKVLSTFLGVPNRSLMSDGSMGPVEWTGGAAHEKAMRGYKFPGNFSVEFVYPKAEAVKIAVAHAASVQAIDPPSDNLPSKQKDLTSDDMRIVTLWTLSPTQVNGAAAIAAEKYKPEVAAPAPAPVVARNEAPVAPPRPARAARTAVAAPAPVPALVTKAPARRPVAAALPHTASNLPAVLLAGVLSLFGAAVLRLRRVSVRR